MYYPDLKIISGYASATYIMVGWLDKEHSFPTGVVSSDFLDRLWLFCSNPAIIFFGYHDCPFCTEPQLGRYITYDGKSEMLGNGDIRVIDHNGNFYASPNLIFHYIVDHHYCPPTEFIEAVLKSPLPGSKEYEEYAELFGWF